MRGPPESPGTSPHVPLSETRRPAELCGPELGPARHAALLDPLALEKEKEKKKNISQFQFHQHPAVSCDMT